MPFQVYWTGHHAEEDVDVEKAQDKLGQTRPTLPAALEQQYDVEADMQQPGNVEQRQVGSKKGR